MTSPIEVTLTPAAVPNVIGGNNYDQDHFAAGVTGDTWTLSNNDTTDGIAHQVSITNNSATDHSAKTAILVGKDEDDKDITETVSLPAGTATVNSTLYFKTLTTITPSATINADTMDIGIKDTITTSTVATNHHRAYKGVFISLTGTATYTVQVTGSKVEGSRPYTWIDSGSASAKTASTATEDNSSTTALRLITTTYTTGAVIVFQVSQGN